MHSKMNDAHLVHVSVLIIVLGHEWRAHHQSTLNIYTCAYIVYVPSLTGQIHATIAAWFAGVTYT